MPPRDLRSTVRWFQESVVAPHERKRRRLAPAGAVILPSRALNARQRVGIYADAYLARLVEALEEDFPALVRLLGHRAFHQLCRAYLERYPSRSWSLNPLGRKLPDLLTGGRRDLARVEVAMSEVFDSEAASPLKPSDFGKIAPEKLPGLRLDFIPAFRLLELGSAVNPFIDGVRQERKVVPPLQRKRSWIAVYRKEFQVWRLDLQEPAHAALSVLRRGRTVGAAVTAAARCWKGTPGDLQSRIRQWFGEWVSEGFFVGVRST